MKLLKIVESNAAVIEAALREINGRSEAHAYTTFREIESVAAEAEKTLGELLLKRDFAGAMWRETSGTAVPNSYNGTRNGTSIVIERRSSAWYLVAIAQVPLYTNGGGRGRLTLTAGQDAAAKARFGARYSVATPAA